MKINLSVSWLIVGLSAVLTGCSMSDIVKVDSPQLDTDINHDYFKTVAGATALLNSSIGSLQSAVSENSLQVAVLTDELVEINPANATPLDARTDEVPHNGVVGIQLKAYSALQAARVRAGYTRHFFRELKLPAYDFAISASYAIEGYSILLLAENLCSGVPLSESPYGGEAYYGKGLSTDSLFRIAIAKFDSSLAIAHDSLKFTTMARVGKGRALISINQFEEAADAVSGVESTHSYKLYYSQSNTPIGNANFPNDAFWTHTNRPIPQIAHDSYQLMNYEGINGMQWYANPYSIDPRLPVTVNVNDTIRTFPPIVRQRKYLDGNIILNLSGWVEAKLIQAEHLLNKKDPAWVVPLNAARASVGLADTVSPATFDQKVNLLFRERSFWFYLTGTRLSDMRRLVRSYGRDVNSVYPVGAYNRSTYVFSYGDAVVFIPTLSEFTTNHQYSGCIDRNP